MNIGEILQQGADLASELLTERLRIIGQPLPTPAEPEAAIRALMIRESIDLAAREWPAFTSFLSRNAFFIASTTQNTRRKRIVPATPSCLRLKEVALGSAKGLKAAAAEAWTRDDVTADQLCEMLGPATSELLLDGRTSLIGASSAQVQLERLRCAIAQLESCWGSFHIWVRNPRISTCKSLILAWQNGEIDSDEFLAWFREDELGLLGDQLDPYVAEELLGLQVSGGQILLPGDMRNLADYSDAEIYGAIVGKARARKWADEKGRRDLVRVRAPDELETVGRRRDALSGTLLPEQMAELLRNKPEGRTARGKELVKAATRTDLERIGRKTGLDPEAGAVLREATVSKSKEKRRRKLMAGH